MTEYGDTPDLSGRLTEDGHSLFLRVYFEDTDFSGFVYHAAYLKFMERGRSDFLRLLGIHHKALYEGSETLPPAAFAVHHMDIKFHAPAHIDDILCVETRVDQISGARLQLHQKVFRNDQMLISAKVTAVLVSLVGKPLRFPADLREKFQPGSSQH